MEYFSLKVDEKLKEIEKETLSSGKAIDELTRLIGTIKLNSRPRRHLRNAIAAAILAMSRINNEMKYPYFRAESSQIALDLLTAMDSGDNCMKVKDRTSLLFDLNIFKDAIQQVLDPTVTSHDISRLRELIRPRTVIFDELGQLQKDLENSLIKAGARSIALVSSTDGNEFNVRVGGTISEEEFLKKFEDLEISDAPPIRYEQLDYGKLTEDSAQAMGD
jgi:hypothetical protein